IDQAIVHPAYSNITQANDIAILVTATEMQYNDTVGPACMPNKLMGREMVDQMLKALGWGRYDPKKPNTDFKKTLKEVDLKIISHRDCNPTQVCTYSPGKDVCMGDSGGPLSWVDPEVNRFTLLGLVSYGPADCGSSPSPGVNTNVSYHRDWINVVISRTKPGLQTCHKV
ncbi:serine protease, partial [Klebsiella pneumoniae]|uniref:serine protease n=1 Tax=Klebsiella pneumoniae TaxID=573 RepID=UPI0024DEB818